MQPSEGGGSCVRYTKQVSVYHLNQNGTFIGCFYASAAERAKILCFRVVRPYFLVFRQALCSSVRSFLSLQ